jgi:phosphatidate cytidylyltransferase
VPRSKARSLNTAVASGVLADWPPIPDRETPHVINPDQGDGKTGGGGGASNLKMRVASAAVLAPAALGITYLGGRVFLALWVIAACGILWEWTSLATRRADARILALGWAALLLAGTFVDLGLPDASFGVIAIGAALAGLAVVALPPDEVTPGAAVWGAGGVVYAGLGLVGPAILRRDAEWGLTALLFLFATVWITDIFAFFAGRAIGGPALWPKVSPKKTWSGAMGGLVGGVAAGVGVAYANGVGKLGIIGVVALLLSVLAQAGDLFESAVKRHFGAKDASRLIPGHGGLMDRLDGFLVAAFAALLIGMLRGGTGAPARGLLVW